MKGQRICGTQSDKNDSVTQINQYQMIINAVDEVDGSVLTPISTMIFEGCDK